MTETPAGRYGRPPMPPATRRRVVIGLGALTILLGLIVAFLGYQRLEGADVEGKAGAYEVLDDHTVSVAVSVTRKDPAVPVVCIVRARALDGSEAGRREILIPPSTERHVQVSTTVRSFRRPSSGDVYGCGTDVPAYLTAP